jgi:hypothetical protein
MLGEGRMLVEPAFKQLDLSPKADGVVWIAQLF